MTINKLCLKSNVPQTTEEWEAEPYHCLLILFSDFSCSKPFLIVSFSNAIIQTTIPLFFLFFLPSPCSLPYVWLK